MAISRTLVALILNKLVLFPVPDNFVCRFFPEPALAGGV